MMKMRGGVYDRENCRSKIAPGYVSRYILEYVPTS